VPGGHAHPVRVPLLNAGGARIRVEGIAGLGRTDGPRSLLAWQGLAGSLGYGTAWLQLEIGGAFGVGGASN
jgi:hypothetical protein